MAKGLPVNPPILLLSLVLMTAGFGKSGSACCQCLIDKECWGNDSCPEDPMGSCEYIRGGGDVPSYAADEWEVCYATGSECEKDSCSDKCEDLD